MLAAKDIMTTDVISINKSLSIMAAAELMVTNHITGIPIVDDDRRLVGIVSEYDVLKLLKAATPDQEKTVEEFMTRDVIAFEDTTPMIQIWEFFIANPNKRRVPIVHEGKLAGVISRGDIVKQIVRIVRTRPENKPPQAHS